MTWRASTVGVLAMSLTVFLMAGCSPDSGSTGESGQSSAPSTGGSTAPPQSPTPTPISIKDYGAALTKAIGPLDSALDRLATAKRYKGLERRVSDVGSAAEKAANGLGGITPPTEVAAEHTKLVAALQAFSQELDDLSSQVDSRSRCTGSAVRAGLGDAGATADLRSALAAMSARLPGSKLKLKLPAADLKSGTRLSNGDFIRSGNRSGRAELAINNGGSTDAVLTLSRGDKPSISVYVRKGRKYTVRGVPDGTYRVFFTGGSGWDKEARAFGRKCVFQRFEDQLRYKTTRDARGIYWQNYTLSLQKVIGGNARTSDVNPDDFPDS